MVCREKVAGAVRPAVERRYVLQRRAMQIGTVCSNKNASNVSIVIITQVLESQRNRGMYGSVSLDRRVSLPWTIIDRVG